MKFKVTLIVVYIGIYTTSSQQLECDKVNFKAEYSRFEFRVFFLLKVLPYQC